MSEAPSTSCRYNSATGDTTTSILPTLSWNISEEWNNVPEYPYNSSQKYLQKYLGPRHATLTESLALTAVYSLIFLTGIFGNICTGLVVLSRSYMRTSTNLYLCSLAISDILTLLLGLPTELYTVWEAYPWRFGQPYCLFKTFLTEMTSSASILTIAAFTIERHVAICYPLLAHTMSMSRLSRTVKVVVGVWLVAAVTALPYPLYTRTYYYLRDPTSGVPISDSLICNIPVKWVPRMRQIFQLSTFSMFVLPMTLITVLYVHIGITVRRSVVRSPMQQGSISAASPVSSVQGTPKRATMGRRSSRKSVTNMLVAVVVAFFVCWAPFHAQRLMTVYVNEDQWTIRLIELQSTLFYVSGILYFVSCTVNPILYNLLSHRYRRAFADVLCGSCSGSSAFARWRRISFARWQTSFASHSPERRRARGDPRLDGILLYGPERIALEVALPRGRCYGSLRSVDVELGVIEQGAAKPTVVGFGSGGECFVDQRDRVIQGVLNRRNIDKGTIGKGFIEQGMFAARGSREKKLADVQGTIDQDMVERSTDRPEPLEAGTTLPTDPPQGTSRLPDLVGTGNGGRRVILQSESDTNSGRISITPRDNGFVQKSRHSEISWESRHSGISKESRHSEISRESRNSGISQESRHSEISRESRYSENCHLPVKRVVQEVTMAGDSVTKYETFLLKDGDQRIEQWRQVKRRGQRDQRVIGGNYVI